MLIRLRTIFNAYPRQFWLLFTGLLISTIGASMIWPFLMIYASERLNLPLGTTTILITINSVMGLIFSFIAGPIIDRFGRKWMMALSLGVNGIGFFLMSHANTLPAFAAIMAMQGAFNPLYRVGADAMMADLIPADRRVDAYSLLRMSNNIGVSLGPAIGGVIATQSYDLAFYIAAAGMIAYSILVIVQAKETLPQRNTLEVKPKERFGGYGHILKDRPFMSFIGAFTLNQLCAAIIWVLLGVYAKENYNLSESLYGLIPTTNALMVVFLQVWVTSFVKRYKPLKALAFGAIFYAIGAGSIALGAGFWGFWISMVITTIGELIMSPTASTLVANMAPADMRGRYMSLYGLTWGIAQGIGPLAGGMLSDNFGPHAIWYGAAFIGLTSVLAFSFLSRREKTPSPSEA